MEQEKLYKVIVPGTDPDFPSLAGDSLFATYVRDNVYRLANQPLTSEKYWLGDLVECESREGILYVTKLIYRAGTNPLVIFPAQEDLNLGEEVLPAIFIKSDNGEIIEISVEIEKQ